MTYLAEMLVSIRRIQKFMLYEEVSTRIDRSMVNCEYKNSKIFKMKSSMATKVSKSDHTSVNKYGEKGYIRMTNATAKWLTYDEDDTLHNIDLEITPGELIAIVGQVGAGKSSLLNVILKELPLTSGSIQVS